MTDWNLSVRQEQVLMGLLKHHDPKLVCAELRIGRQTYRSHLRAVCSRMGLQRVSALSAALKYQEWRLRGAGKAT